MTVLASGPLPLVHTAALWTWNTTNPLAPTVSGFPSPTGVGTSLSKSGVTPSDLAGFVGVPLQFQGNPPIPITQPTLYQWIRWAEDSIEQDTSLLLCQTWVASPPAQTLQQTLALGIVPAASGDYQRLGYDYDLADTAYDFQFPRAQDEGWMYNVLRYRPVQSTNYTTTDYTAVKNTAYVYPLLNQFFRMPINWNVEDRDYGLIRYVPAANVEMLPLFAMQLAFMGFSENVPGAIWLQYTAGLTPYDYQSRYSFVKELVLCETAITALGIIQGSVNLGVGEFQTQIDGLLYRAKYDPNGAYAGLIRTFTKRRDELKARVMSKLNGIALGQI